MGAYFHIQIRKNNQRAAYFSYTQYVTFAAVLLFFHDRIRNIGSGVCACLYVRLFFICTIPRLSNVARIIKVVSVDVTASAVGAVAAEGCMGH